MKDKMIVIMAVLAAIIATACNEKTSSLQEAEIILEKRMDSLLSVMTLEEKIGQMSQVNLESGITEALLESIRKGEIGSLLNAGDAINRKQLQQVAMKESRLGIPLIFGRDVIHGYRTVFPIPLAQSCSWNTSLVEKAAAIAAYEAASDGIHWTFSPMLDIARDPRWGRIAEGNGEDSYLGSQLAIAMVKGYQGDDLSDPASLAACAKHFAGYGAAEGGRDYNTTLIPETELRNVYLPPFHAAVKANIATVMSAFNDLNGTPATANEFLLKKILRTEWGFRGFVVSDWTSVTEMINHGYAAGEKDAALKAVQAGVDMEMVSRSFTHYLKELVQSGTVDEKLIDDAVRNILSIKFRKGLFDNPYPQAPDEITFLRPENLEVAKELAIQSTVLLKNDNSVLPLRENIQSLAVIGPLADAPLEQLGMWTPDGRVEDAITPLAAIRKKIGKDRVIYVPALETGRSTDKSQFARAVAAARNASACVVFLGEEQILSGEAHSRAFLNLPGAQEELITELARTGKPIVLVIMAGRPLIFSRISGKVQAILYAWHGGTMAGPALTDLLFGIVSPSGKLSVSFPRAEGQIPLYYNHRNTGRPPQPENQGIPAGTPLDPVNFTSNYLDLDYTPEYPFGYGLSYTTFDYSPVTLSSPEITAGDTLIVRTSLSNKGKYNGTEIVQIYIRDMVGSITRPVKELKGFQRINLKPGESREVTFKLTATDLSFYRKDLTFGTETGEFMVWVGKSSADHDLKGISFSLSE